MKKKNVVLLCLGVGAAAGSSNESRNIGASTRSITDREFEKAELQIINEQKQQTGRTFMKMQSPVISPEEDAWKAS